jgi:nucleotide-binding universal stress UspA family protein
MTTILFPTRGGQSSFPNQDRVIALAKERDAHLIFLYVSNVEFLGSVSSAALVDVVQDELEHMGEFLLAMAQERADKAGWKADAVVRSGSFTDALRDVIKNYDVDVLVLGAPGGGHAVTTENFLNDLKDEMVAEFDLEVILL